MADEGSGAVCLEIVAADTATLRERAERVEEELAELRPLYSLAKAAAEKPCPVCSTQAQ